MADSVLPFVIERPGDESEDDFIPIPRSWPTLFCLSLSRDPVTNRRMTSYPYFRFCLHSAWLMTKRVFQVCRDCWATSWENCKHQPSRTGHPKMLCRIVTIKWEFCLHSGMGIICKFGAAEKQRRMASLGPLDYKVAQEPHTSNRAPRRNCTVRRCFLLGMSEVALLRLSDFLEKVSASTSRSSTNIHAA